MSFNIDADIANADWAKRTWDIYTPDGQVVTSLVQLKSVFPAYSDAELKHFLDLPVAENMPAQLKGELQRL